jgi:hypothetical protein
MDTTERYTYNVDASDWDCPRSALECRSPHMSTTTSLNQVDLQAVGALVEKIQQDHEAARTTWASEVRWTGAFRSESRVRTFPPGSL